MQLRDPLTGRLRSVRAHPFGFLAMGATLALIPWTLIYISQLPDRHTAKHWSLAWVGFDLVLCVALGTTAWSALRERALLIVGLIVSATLLVCDAWFDVATSLDTSDQDMRRSSPRSRSSCRSRSTSRCWRAATCVTAIRVSRPEYADRGLHAVPLAREGGVLARGSRHRAELRGRPSRTPRSRGRRAASVCAAESCTRMRASPFGTTG